MSNIYDKLQMICVDIKIFMKDYGLWNGLSIISLGAIYILLEHSSVVTLLHRSYNNMVLND